MPLKIPKPCKEKYNSMSPSELGKICTVCNTEVVDFTNWETKEILTFIQNSKGKVCGKLNSNQTRKTYAFSLNYRRLMSIGASLLLIGNWNLTSAKESAKFPFLQNINLINNSKIQYITDSVLVQFLDVNNRKIPHIKIINLQSQKWYETDSNGFLKLPVLENDQNLYESRHLGYTNKLFKIKSTNQNQVLKITIAQHEEVIGEIRVKYPLKTRIKRIFNKLSVRDES